MSKWRFTNFLAYSVLLLTPELSIFFWFSSASNLACFTMLVYSREMWRTKKCFSRRPRDVWLFPDFNFQKVFKRIPNFTFLFQILLSPIRNKTELKCSPAVDSASSVDSVFRFRIRFSDSKQYCILHHAIAPYNSILIQNHKKKKNNNCYL